MPSDSFTPAYRQLAVAARTRRAARRDRRRSSTALAGRRRHRARSPPGCPGTIAPIEAALVGLGFREDRRQHQMRVPLPRPDVVRVPDGVELRAFRPGTDDAAWLRVNNRAFANHPDQGGWVEEILARRMAEPWFDPAGFLLAWRGDDLAGFCWTKVHEEPERLGEIFVIGVDPDAQGTRPRTGARARRARPPGAASGTARPACSTSRRRTRPRSALYESLGFVVAPHRHRARAGAAVTHPRTATTRGRLRRLARRPRRSPRYRADQVWQALDRAAPAARGGDEPARRTCAPRWPRTSRSRSRPLVEQRGDDGDTVKWLLATVDGLEIETVLMVSPDRATVCVSSQAGCAMGCTFCATGQAGFDRHLDPGEIVEQVAHAMHHVAAAGHQRRVHGHGRAAGQLRPDVGRGDAPPRRLRDLGAPHHGVDRRHRPRDAPHGRRGAAGHARGLAPRAERRAARHDDPDQRPLPAARGHRRRARRRAAPRPAGHVRVRVHRGRERRARARRRAGRAPRAARTARDPREPDPAEPHRRLRRPGGHRSRTSGRSPTASPPTGSRPRSGATGAPTSTPPADSSGSGRTGPTGPPSTRMHR